MSSLNYPRPLSLSITSEMERLIREEAERTGASIAETVRTLLWDGLDHRQAESARD